LKEGKEKAYLTGSWFESLPFPRPQMMQTGVLLFESWISPRKICITRTQKNFLLKKMRNKKIEKKQDKERFSKMEHYVFHTVRKRGVSLQCGV
jgi:hypothetical protein